MVVLTDFRALNTIEKKIIRNSLVKISSNFISFLNINNQFLYVLIDRNNELKKYPEIFFIPEDLEKIILNFENKIQFSGIYLGFIKKGEFYLSIEGAEYFVNIDLFPKKLHIFVDQKAEKSILYGNHIKKWMIKSDLKNMKIDSHILIFNQLNELISISKLIKNENEIKFLKMDDIIALNIIDKGYFLRKQP